MRLIRLLYILVLAATLFTLGGLASQVVHGQEGLTKEVPPHDEKQDVVWDLSDHSVPVGQELGEMLFFDLSRNDFYGQSAPRVEKVIITAYSHWEDPETSDLVITSWVWITDYTTNPLDSKITQIGQVRLAADRPVIAETEVAILPDGHATRFYWYEEGRWAYSQTLPVILSQGLQIPQILYIPADGQMLRWQ